MPAAPVVNTPYVFMLSIPLNGGKVRSLWYNNLERPVSSRIERDVWRGRSVHH